jgi:DNA polymerase-3 subunit chi
MTDIRFYHLTVQSLDQALPAILAKALDAGHRILVKCPDETTAARISDQLWTFRPDSFLPHGTKKDGHEADQPIYITAGNDNPNGAGVVVLTGGTSRDDLADYMMCCEMLDGHDGEAVAAARERWKAYKEAGHTVTYYQQTDTGGWEKKA